MDNFYYLQKNITLLLHILVIINYLINNYQVLTNFNKLCCKNFFNFFFSLSLKHPFFYHPSRLIIKNNFYLTPIARMSWWNDGSLKQFFFSNFFFSNFFYVTCLSNFFLDKFEQLWIFFFLGLISNRDLFFLTYKFHNFFWMTSATPIFETKLLKLRN